MFSNPKKPHITGPNPESVFHLTSTSAIKLEALRKFLGDDADSSFEIIGHDTSGCGNPEQPVGHLNTLICCKRRIEWLMRQMPQLLRSKNHIIVSIENGIEKNQDNVCQDYAHVMIYIPGDRYWHAKSEGIDFPLDYWDEAKSSSVESEFGWSITVGDIFHKRTGCDKKNWMKEHAKQDRLYQITDALTMWTDTNQHRHYSYLEANTRYVSDFPKQGVMFKDLSPILANGPMFEKLLDQCQFELSTLTGIDIIVGLESRGFIYGAALAAKIGVGFVPIRKKNKLPPPFLSKEYEKEYGKDTFEIASDIIPIGARVLIVDDLLATGGSFACAIDLILSLGLDITIVGVFAILRVEGLKDVSDKVLGEYKTIVLA